VTKFYFKTLAELDHKLDLSRTGACVTMHAAQFHGTTDYAVQALATHRAISRDIRESISVLLQKLDWYDEDVERAMIAMRQRQLEIRRAQLSTSQKSSEKQDQVGEKS
jgi:CBS-domain-containing membrane protein